ncbi:MAG: shikimate kinase, partial [Anaerolineae bacterium]|nr:shikimate kinase [Anaerolineae bacterium]
VAQALNWTFVDTDSVIEACAGRTIAEIFAQDGEPSFRALEAEVCIETAGGSQLVIATGGGALLNPVVYAAFAAASLLVNLRCDLDEILRRVGHDPARPLFTTEREKLARLYADRADHYNSLPFQVDTTHRAPPHIAEEILNLWRSKS